MTWWLEIDVARIAEPDDTMSNTFYLSSRLPHANRRLLSWFDLAAGRL
jgi:hypothetical protein